MTLAPATLMRSGEDLPALRATLGKRADLSELEEYLRWRERKVRGRIARPLAAFADLTARWPFEQRRALVRWIGEPWVAAAGHEPTSSFAKRGDPVFRLVVAPTLREWRSREPSDPEAPLLACLWDEPAEGSAGGRVACLRALLERHPDLLPARRALIRAVLDQIGFDQHEWPHGYLGNPATDLRLLAETRVALDLAPDDEWGGRMARAVTEMQDVAALAAERQAAWPTATRAGA